MDAIVTTHRGRLAIKVTRPEKPPIIMTMHKGERSCNMGDLPPETVRKLTGVLGSLPATDWAAETVASLARESEDFDDLIARIADESDRIHGPGGRQFRYFTPLPKGP